MRSILAASPLGRLRLAAEGEHLRGVAFVGQWPEPTGAEPLEGAGGTGAPPPADVAPPEAGSRADAVLAEAAEQLAAYFDGVREVFDLPLGPRGTPFQRAVWRELTRIPYGTTASYGEVARRLGLPAGASRAVGVAASQNPLVVVVPCHRMVGADGALVGFGGGVARKERLLALEGSALL